MTPKLKAVVLVLSLALAGCSALALGYKYADKLALHELDRMFDLTSQQEEEFGPRVKAEIDRLKRERMPDVLRSLETYAKAWNRGPTEADALALLDEYDKVRLDVASHMAPAAAAFLTSLSKKQIDYFEEELADSNEKLEELLAANPQSFAKKQRKSLIKSFERWLGSVSDEQEDQLLALVPHDRDTVLQMYEGRRTSQKSLLELLKRPASASEIVFRLLDWTKEPHKMRGMTAAQGQKRRQTMLRVLTETYAVADAEQRQQVQAKVFRLIADLRNSGPVTKPTQDATAPL